MIVPKPRNESSQQRTVASVCTVVLMVGAYAGLRGTPVPVFGSSRAVIRELDPLFLERYATPVRETPDPDIPTPAPEAEKTAATLERDVGVALDELVRRFEPTPTNGTDEPRPSRPTAGTTIGSQPDNPDFDRLFGSPVSVPVMRPRGPDTGARGSIGRGIDLIRTPEPDSRDRDESETAPNLTVEAASPAPRPRASLAATDVVVREFDPETFSRMEGDRLTTWIGEHPVDLPVGVKVHLNYASSFLTTSVSLVSDGRAFELFLMYNQNLRELHIVLVEGDRSVYLIDRGFQEQSRSLRQGTVRRLNGDIVAVNSRAGAASSQQAQEFYSIFLSWWEGVPHGRQ